MPRIRESVKLSKNISLNEAYFRIDYFIRGTSTPFEIILSIFRIYNNFAFMNITRVILCVIFPPLAVIDKGCGSILIVSILTIAGWVPGIVGALLILNRDDSLNQKFENSFVMGFLIAVIIAIFIIIVSFVLFR